MKNSSTEEKIKTAARKLFMQKGYVATKTRDIAKEADINLALLNYYFRSKEKLFQIIMMEHLQFFKQGIVPVINDKNTSLEEKFESFISSYIDLLIQQPDIPLFILNEIRNNPDQFMKIGLRDELAKSYFMKQLNKVLQSKSKSIEPFHVMVSMMGLTVFPFIVSPMLKNVGKINQLQFNALMEERKTLIPKWMNAIIQSK